MSWRCWTGRFPSWAPRDLTRVKHSTRDVSRWLRLSRGSHQSCGRSSKTRATLAGSRDLSTGPVRRGASVSFCEGVSQQNPCSLSISQIEMHLDAANQRPAGKRLDRIPGSQQQSGTASIGAEVHWGRHDVQPELAPPRGQGGWRFSHRASFTPGRSAQARTCLASRRGELLGENGTKHMLPNSIITSTRQRLAAIDFHMLSPCTKN